MIKKIFVFFVLLSIAFQIESFTIVNSGLTNLGTNISEVGIVVTIDTSDVILDLRGHILSTGTAGVVINPGLSNIIVKNGFIDSCNVGVSIRENCSKIQLENVEITNCPDRGIEILGTSGNEVSTVFFQKIKIENCCTSGSADFIFHANYIQELILKNILMLNNGASSVDLRMANIQNSAKCIFDKIMCIDNRGSTFEGFRLENSTNALLSRCDVRVNSATGSFVGFRFTGNNTRDNTCRNCGVTENTSTNGTLIGFDLLSTVSQHILQHCIAASNVVSGAVASANCFGFNLDQVNLCSLLKCKAMYNCTTGDGTTNIVAGFNIGTSGGAGSGVKDSEFCECFAANNRGFNDQRSFGFRVVSDATGNTNNIYIANIAVRNGISLPIAQNQMVSNGGVGSSPGGVSSSSIVTRTTLNINTSDLGLSNLRVI